MADLSTLNILIPFLASNNVQTFKGLGLELSFYETKPGQRFTRIKSETEMAADQKAEAEKPKDPKAEAAADIPESLDNEMPYDQILNWSASPDPAAPVIPMTGDQQLDPEAGKT